MAEAFKKNDELQNYHMISNTSTYGGTVSDVNIENGDGFINMAGTQTYEATIYSHSDLSEVGKEMVTEYIYQKGNASMLYRGRDGAIIEDISFEILTLKDSVRQSIDEEINSLDSSENGNEYVKNTVIEDKEDGSKVITIKSTQDVFTISSEGYLLVYKGLTEAFSIDTLNEVVLDYTYCSI